MSKHTPAPWSHSWISGALRHIGKNVDSDSFWFPDEDEDRETVNIPSYYTKGDVDLIASAPELLQALKTLVERVNPNEQAIYNHMRKDWENAVQAIAKAEGV